MKHHAPSKASSPDQQKQNQNQPTSRNQSHTNNNNNAAAVATMKDVEKKIKKEMKKSINKSSLLPPDNNYSSPTAENIEPPRLHRDMRLICDVFRISDQTRHALRSFDASNLEDFGLMTTEDYADMIVTQARIGKPLPPLQQRKVRVLLSWVQSLSSSTAENNIDKTITTSVQLQQSTTTPSEPTTDLEVQESKSDNDTTNNTTPRKRGGGRSPNNWENQFYTDLPRLKQELRDMGKNNQSNWASEFLSLRWIFCG